MSAPVFQPTEQGLIRRAIDRLRYFGGLSGRDHTELSAPHGFTFVTADDGIYLARNAHYDAVNATWNRYDTTSDVVILNLGGGGFVTMLTAGSGANPIAGFTTSTIVAANDSGWVNVGSFGTNWATYDGTTYLAQYRKLSSGMVIFQGMVKKTAALGLPETMFTLPAGFRPGKAGPLAAASAAGYAGLQMYTTGQMNIEVGGSATWVSLAGLTYLAEL